MMFIKQVDSYFKKNPYYSAVVHVVVGVGIGILMTYPVVGSHPMRWGLVFLGLGLAGHLYPVMKGK